MSDGQRNLTAYKAVCYDCNDLRRTFTEDNSFEGNAKRSAEQACRGHASQTDCSYAQTQVITALGVDS